MRITCNDTPYYRNIFKSTVNGRSGFVFNSTELGHPMFNAQIPIPQGETVEIVYELTEPTTAGLARVPVQPLVDTPAITIDVPACR